MLYTIKDPDITLISKGIKNPGVLPAVRPLLSSKKCFFTVIFLGTGVTEKGCMISETEHTEYLGRCVFRIRVQQP